MPKDRMIASHNMELDGRMGGGIPVGSLVLIEGDSGSGKSVFSQQMAWGALKQGFSVVVLTSENSVKSLISQMQSIDLDVLDHLLLGRLRVYPMALSTLGAQATKVLGRILQQQRGYDVVVVDSFTSAIARAPSEQNVMRFFETAKKQCSKGQTVFVTVHASTIHRDMIGPLRSMCDANLVLRSEQDGQRLVKTLQVAKIRGAGGVTGSIVGFDVEPGWGMRVIPISKARG